MGGTYIATCIIKVYQKNEIAKDDGLIGRENVYFIDDDDVCEITEIFPMSHRIHQLAINW